MRVKITLSGPDGVLNSIVVVAADKHDDEAIGAGVRRLTEGTCWHVGDSLTIEALD